MKVSLEPAAKKNYIDVYTEGVCFVTAPDSMITLFGIQDDADHDITALSCFAVAVNLYLCRLESYRILSRKQVTSLELFKKLQKKGFIQETASVIVDIFLLKGEIDDTTFAGDFVRSRARSKLIGPIRMRQEMILREIPRSLIDSSIKSYYSEEVEQEIAVEALQRRYLRLNKPRRRDKIYLFLVRKGFLPGTAGRLAREYEIKERNRGDNDEEQPGDTQRFF